MCHNHNPLIQCHNEELSVNVEQKGGSMKPHIKRHTNLFSLLPQNHALKISVLLNKSVLGYLSLVFFLVPSFQAWVVFGVAPTRRVYF